MARGSQLSTIVQMVKTELMVDADSTISPGADATIKAMARVQQSWLADRHSWEFLKVEYFFTMTAGTRYYDWPTSGGKPVFDLNRINRGKLDCFWGNIWSEVVLGIDPVRDYTPLNPTLGQKYDPVLRWQLYRTGSTLKFEVWPLPATATQLRMRAQKPLDDLIQDTDLAELDDVLIAQFTAAKLAARMKQGDAQALLSQAQETYKNLTSGDPEEPVMFNMQGSPLRRSPGRDWSRPVVAAMITPP